VTLRAQQQTHRSHDVMAIPQTPQPKWPFFPDAIPGPLRENPRWAPWKAVWNPKRAKWDKIPCYPTAPFYGLSTARPERWFSFDQAVAAAKANPTIFAGVGYVMTRPHGIVGIDLDRCYKDGQLAEWAYTVARSVGSYTEASPSGVGLRIFTLGQTPVDWTNHEIGIEVYSGHEPRFLTVTGAVVRTFPDSVGYAPLGVLDEMATNYARERSSAQVINLEVPDILDELAMPNLAELDLPWQARDFLTEGTHRGDRSRELFAAAVALYGAGLGDAEVFSVLATSPHAMEVALDHRRQDSDRALTYLWVEHAQKAKGRARPSVATADDFEDVSGAGAGGGEGGTSSAPGANPEAPGQAKPKRGRFAVTPLVEFLDQPRPRWAVKGVLPESGIGMIFGPSTGGKSFFALDLVLSVARGVAWRGRKVRQGGVAYICAEGAGGFPDRLRAYAGYHGVDLAGVPLHMIPAAPNLLEKADVKELVGGLQGLDELRIIVIDTLAQTTAGADENSGQDMSRAVAHCNALTAATGALVCLIGHSGKDESRGVRGWSGLFASFDFAIQIERSGDYRAATLVKVKDGKGEGDEYPFHLTSAVLGTDEDGEEITSAVVLPGVAGNAGGPRKAAPKGKWERLLLRLAKELLDLNDTLTTGELLQAGAAEMPKEAAEKRDRRSFMATRALESLVTEGFISTKDGLVVVL